MVQVRTAWHGPGDVSPVGTPPMPIWIWRAQLRIQESTQFNQATQDVFPGSPTIKNGYLYVNEAPGLGWT